MATIYRGTATSQPVSLGGNIPGDAATGHLLRDIAAWADNLAPQATPILSDIPKGQPRSQAKLEWGSTEDLPRTSNTAEDMTNVETDLDVTTGHGSRFKKWHKIAVYELDANGLPDWGAREEMVVSAEPSTDTLTVIRGRGTTTARTFTSGAHVAIIGTALPEGQDFTIGPIVYGTFYSNYYQLFEDMAHVTEEGNVTANAEYSEREMARQIRFKTMRLKQEIERTLFQGTKNAGNISTPAPSEMGGFVGFIPSANTTDANDQPITPYDIETAGAALWDSVGENAAKRLFMSMRTARYFDGILNKYRQIDGGTTRMDLRFTEFETRVGAFRVEVTRWIPEGVVVGADLSRMQLIPYEGMDWKEKEVETAGPYRKRAVYGKFTLKVESPETMFMIKNFDTNLANYGRTV